jgi:hypothetical protein
VKRRLPGRPEKPRLDEEQSKRVRALIKKALDRLGMSYSDFDEYLGDVKPRWTDNALNRRPRMLVDRAVRILSTLPRLLERKLPIDSETLSMIGQAYALSSHIHRDARGTLMAIPMMLPKSSVPMVKEAFRRYATYAIDKPERPEDAAHWAVLLADFLDEVRESGSWVMRQNAMAELERTAFRLDGVKIQPETFERCVILLDTISDSFEGRPQTAPQKRSIARKAAHR